MTSKRLTGQLLLAVSFLGLLVACRQSAPSPTAAGATSATGATALPANPTETATAVPATPTEEPAPTATGMPGAPTFDAARAFSYVEAQLEFGPRWPGSPGHEATGDYIVSQLQAAGWDVHEQLFEYRGVQGRNIVGRANQDEDGVILIGAHYDTRRIANNTPGGAENNLPTPGAVDGASGVAVLLELANTLEMQRIPHEVWLTFFDLEDNGNGGIPGWDWIAGSRYMAQNLEITPQAVVVLDMVGDADQQLYYEGYSDPDLQQEVWQVAADLGFEEAFIPELEHTIIDDHLPFSERGIPTALIIDIDYPYWHTVEDTLDKVSSESLFRAGRTVEVWLEERLDQVLAIGGNHK